jgi:hypothetical protein
MALNNDLILDTFIRIAREALPTELSLIGPNADLPAVIRARQDGPKPSYPYTVLDHLDTIDESGWLLSENINSNDETVYETNKLLLLNYRVYGGNAQAIAQKLHGFFRLNRVLGDIRTSTGGAVVTLDGIDSLPVLLAETYLESASFNITFAITDVFVDTIGSDSFTKIVLDGDLHRGTGDVSPLDLDVTVPVP